MRCRLILPVFLLPLAALGADDIKIERIIGTEHPGAYKHPASITQLQDGGLMMTYYGGGGEYEDDSKVWGMRRKAGESAWSEPQLLADTPFLGEGNGVVWQAPDGLVWLFYVQRYGETWSESRTLAKISEDGGETWSDSMVLSFELGTMCRGLPIVLNNGDYLLPVYHETGSDINQTFPDTCSFFLRHDPKKRTWTETGRIYSKTGNLQAEPVQITDEHLIAYIRPGGDFEPSTSRYILRAESHDGGATWSRAEDTEFPNPNAAVSFIKLQSGKLLLVDNDSMNHRTPLTAAISEDNGQTWPHRRDLATSGLDNTFAYPMAIQAKDGTIHVICTTDVRKTVILVSFKEDAVLGHSK
jgi:predicted neuraminidase